MKRPLLMTMLLMSAVALSGAVYAGGGHDHSHDDDSKSMAQSGHDEIGMSHNKSAMFLEKRAVDGYQVSFHVMQAKPGMEHGGSHNLMIKIEQGDVVIDDVLINSKVIYPDGGSDTKPLMKMGDWYMNGYDLGNRGRHQLMILFKTADGAKHQSGVYYSVE